MVAPCRGTQIDIPSLSENITNTVELDQGSYPSTKEHADPTRSSSLRATSRPPACLGPYHESRQRSLYLES